ncbi:MAG: hypothetical protein HZT43_09325 [Exiguobacterium profundum]|nr:MAG: hypothetical protein HZT43_09325 [Exiguobacterium profundum]
MRNEAALYARHLLGSRDCQRDRSRQIRSNEFANFFEEICPKAPIGAQGGLAAVTAGIRM